MISLSRPLRLATLIFGSGLLWWGAHSQGAVLDNPPPQAANPVPASTPGFASAGSTSFDAVTARLDRGGTFYLYLSAAQWLQDLSTRVSQWRDLVAAQGSKLDADRQNIARAFDLGTALIKQSGLEQVTGLGASSITLSPGFYRNTFFTHHYAGKETGLLSTLFGTAPHALSVLDLLPADTAAADLGDFDAPRLLTEWRAALEHSGIPEVQQGLASGLKQFSTWTGLSFDDFVRSLGTSDGVILTLDSTKNVELPLGVGQKQSFPYPRLAVLLEVKDDLIFGRIDQLLGFLPGVAKTDEADLRLRTFAIPGVPMFTVRATVARWDKYLILASDDQVVRDIIAAQKTGQGFKASPAFAKLSAGMPVEGNSICLAAQSFVDAMRSLQKNALEHQPNSTEGQQALLHKLLEAQTTGATYAVSAHLDDGWLTVSQGAQSMNQILVPLMILPAGIAAGIAVPVFHSVQEKSTQQKSLMQAKRVGDACRAYAAAHGGAFPPALEDLVPAFSNKSLLVPPTAPDESIGYKYKIGLTMDSPSNAILLEDNTLARGKRIIVYVDGHAEIR